MEKKSRKILPTPVKHVAAAADSHQAERKKGQRKNEENTQTGWSMEKTEILIIEKIKKNE